MVFSEGLQQFRDLLEPGAAVLLTLSAELQGDDVRARIQMVEPLDQAAAKLSKGCGCSCALRRRSRASPAARGSGSRTRARQGRRRGLAEC